jgi:hypothetical protein
VSGSGLGATIEHVEPFLAGRDLLHTSLTCRGLYEAVTGDKRLHGIMLHGARVAAFHCSDTRDEKVRDALCFREWGIDPVDFASATSQLLPRCYRLEQQGLWLLHASFEAVVMRILQAAVWILSSTKRPDPLPPAHETGYPYSVRVTPADLNGGLRLCLWGGGPFLDLRCMGPEELRRFPELDRGILRLARKSSVLEFDPCLFGFVGALLGRYVRWVVASVTAKAAAGAVEEAHEEGRMPVERVNQVLGAVHRALGSTRLLDPWEAPGGGSCALEPEAFERMIAQLQPDAGLGTDFRVIPSFGHLWYLHAALNREVENMLAFLAAATRDVSDAFVSWAPPVGFAHFLYGLFEVSPWGRASCGAVDREEYKLDCAPLEESLRLAIKRAGIREWLVEDVLDYVGRLVVVYIKAMLTYWEATEIVEPDEDAEEWDEDVEECEEEETDEEEEEEEDAAGQFHLGQM